MHRILSTSSFRRLPAAFLIAMVSIVCIEAYVWVKAAPSYSNHEVDWLLNQLRDRRFNAEYLIIGDSVGRQISKQFISNPKFAILATNQAVETTGHYFLVRRYLARNPAPKAVIFIGLPFHFRDLDQVYTENFVLRTFTHTREISDIASTKYNPVMTAKMIAYKFLPTFKYRLILQENMVGFTNSDIYSGFDNTVNPAKAGRHSLLRLMKKRRVGHKASTVHFEKLLAYLAMQDIPLYYIPAPIKQQKRKKKQSDSALYQDLFGNYLPAIQSDHFHYFDSIVEHPGHYFSDRVHFAPEWLPVAEKYFSDILDSIIAEIESRSSISEKSERSL